MNLLLACALALGTWIGVNANNAPAPVPPRTTVARDSAGNIVVEDFAGDRMFTTTQATYDPTTFELLHATRHASCCGSSWTSSVERNADGSYDVKAEQSGFNGDYKEQLTGYREPAGSRLIAGGTAIVPLMYERAHVTNISILTYGPIRPVPQSIAAATASSLPGIPAGDALLTLTQTWPQPHTVDLWYDPCTFKVDASTEGGRTLYLRTPARP